MPESPIDSQRVPTSRNNVGRASRLLAAGLLVGLFVLAAATVGLVPPSVLAQPPDDPPIGSPIVSPLHFYFPFDDAAADFYTFEVADLDVYNLEFSSSDASVGIGRGLGNNDVLEIVGMGQDSYGLATPKPIGFGERVQVQGTVGVPMDGNTPRLDGIVPGQSFAGFQINDKQSDPPKFVIGAGFPSENGTTVVGATQDGLAGQIFLPGVFEVELRVNRGVDDIDNIPHDGAGVRYRPAGSTDDFAILFDRYFQITDEGSDPVLPNQNGFQTTFGADRLGPGGTMFIDDVFTSNLGDPAVVPVANLIGQAFDEEIEAFVLLANNPLGASRLIERSIEKLTQAQQQISQGGFQAGSRSSDALVELNKAKQLDQEARAAIANGDSPTASDKLIEASTAKARAELFLEGHNPQPGPFPDGLGGFDIGDPIFADGFESGDVSAWSTGEPTNRHGDRPGQCVPDGTTLCLPGDDRFRATIDWKDFSNNTGSGQVLSESADTGVFWFFDPANPELTVKLLDQCTFNNHFWVFYAGTTNVEFTMTVTDTQTSQTKSYFNPLGMPAAAITDTSAFATCP